MAPSKIRTVALLGADSKLGPVIIAALLAAHFKVTVLKREGSTSPSNYPASVTVTRVPDALDTESLTPLLTGQDAVIVSIKGTQTDVQKRIAVAALHAGVQRFIPADFGSCDSASPRTGQLVPLYLRKREMREFLTELVATHPARGFSWTSLVTGHFFDWKLAFIHLYPREARADILDDGATRFSLSTLAQIGRATAAVLTHPDASRDKMLYVHSFLVSQMQVVAAFERATGQTWAVTRIDAREFEEREKAKMEQGDAEARAEATEELVWLLGTEDADWTGKENFAMRLLGLEEESLQEQVERIVKEGIE
nr:pinoresinol reductase 2 [Quercus suber]